MIQFQEHEDPGYALRTRTNASVSHGTIAFAVDFKSPGEILTHKCCYGAGKPYLRVDVTEYEVMTDWQIQEIADACSRFDILHLNVAGNSLPTVRAKYTQEGMDARIFDCISRVHALWPFEHIRSGGQSGADESGLKAADILGIRATCLAPKGWLYRDSSGRDIRDEVAFKKRFGEKYDYSFI